MAQDLKTMYGLLKRWSDNTNYYLESTPVRFPLIKKMVKAAVVFHIILIVGIGAVLGYYSSNNPAVVPLMYYRAYVNEHSVRPVAFIPLKKIPNDIKKMVISIEDYKFYKHHGVDIEAIKRAVIINHKVGYRMYGASTITQQLSRTIFLLPVKSMMRKYIELIIALQMEIILDKDRILELYLNYCELGKGIFGIKNASYHYFNRNINRLTNDEKSRLLAILANPISFSPYNFKGSKLIANRYYILKFRYYTYNKYKTMMQHAYQY